jgi:formamidopyrimidine-DNA glycosylase
MPELPEVETLRRGLSGMIEGATIIGARVLAPKMVKGGLAEPGALAQTLQGLTIAEIGRRGKYLILRLDNGYYVLLHLKMRGRVIVVPADREDAKYLAIALLLDAGRLSTKGHAQSAYELRFHDVWTWGELRVVSADEFSNLKSLKEMGAEPLSEAWTSESFRSALARRGRRPVKAALLDQRVAAGVGNIYADESLFRSGIRPDRLVASLTNDETSRLHRRIREVLAEAADLGGTKSESFVDCEGRAGGYVPRVYDRGGKACLTCRTLLSRSRIAGRGTVFCSSCQS